MRDLITMVFVLTLAVGGAIRLGATETPSQSVACTASPAGSWFHTEYCQPARQALEELPGVELVAGLQP